MHDAGGTAQYSLLSSSCGPGSDALGGSKEWKGRSLQSAVHARSQLTAITTVGNRLVCHIDCEPSHHLSLFLPRGKRDISDGGRKSNAGQSNSWHAQALTDQHYLCLPAATPVAPEATVAAIRELPNAAPVQFAGPEAGVSHPCPCLPCSAPHAASVPLLCSLSGQCECHARQA